MSFVEKESAWLSSIILPQILQNGYLLDDYDKTAEDTFKVDAIAIQMIGSEEAFMLTLCYRATVNFEYAGVKQERKLVVKKTPNIPTGIYDSINFDALFRNEIEFYTNILPEIQKITAGKFVAPKYYHSEIKQGFALLILGDFAADGWSMSKNKVGLTLEHARIAVKYLGRFHGIGYALKHNQSDRFSQLTANLKESRFANDDVHPEWSLTLRTSGERVIKAVRTYQPQIDEAFVKKWAQLTVDYVGYGRQRLAPREPLTTLCHGDYLRNNVAFKYEISKGGEQPLDVMMFDYQTMRLSSPMVDLSVFLALTVYADVRFNYFDIIFNDYLTALSETYEQSAKKPIPEFLHREPLIKEYIRFLPYSISITAAFLMTLVEPPAITQEEMFNRKRTNEEIIHEAMTQGGEIVDREIAHQVKEMFDLSRSYNVEISEGIVEKT